jgi:hypothetical protein
MQWRAVEGNLVECSNVRNIFSECAVMSCRIHVSPMPLPPVIRQWLVFCMILLVPLITFMVATFISGVDAYTAALLSELVSLLLLLVIYFISVTVAQVRICWDVMNDGGGKWDTMQRVLWLSVESHGAIWIPRCCPIPATYDSTHPLQRNEDGQSSAESAMAGCPSMTRNPSYGANGVVTAGAAHNDSQVRQLSTAQCTSIGPTPSPSLVPH